MKLEQMTDKEKILTKHLSEKGRRGTPIQVLIPNILEAMEEYAQHKLASDGGSADVSGILQKERFRIFEELLIEEQETAFSRKVEVDTDELYNVIFKNGTIEP